MKNTGISSFILNKIDDNNTAVRWNFISPAKFPFSLFAPILKNMPGKQISISLQNLKTPLKNSYKAFLDSFAQVSFNVTVLLKIIFSSLVSLSKVK